MVVNGVGFVFVPDLRDSAVIIVDYKSKGEVFYGGNAKNADKFEIKYFEHVLESIAQGING